MACIGLRKIITRKYHLLFLALNENLENYAYYAAL